MIDSTLKKALRYQFDYTAWSCVYVYGITFLIACAIGMLGFVALTLTVDSVTVYSSIGPVVFVHFLVMGIVCIRADLRFFLQHGLGRRTTYFGHLYCSLVSSIVLGLVSELLNYVGGFLPGSLFASSAFDIRGALAGWLTHSIVFFLAWQLGVLISLIYYRLGKLGKVVFSVVAVATVVFALPRVIGSLAGAAGDLADLIQRFVESPPNFSAYVLFFVLPLGILAAVGNFLLIRRVQIKD